jgi:hypothetical protein
MGREAASMTGNDDSPGDVLIGALGDEAELLPRSVMPSHPDKRRESQKRYDQSEKGRARHARYNDSEKGRERWLRYETGFVGTVHRMADNSRKRCKRIEEDRRQVLEMGPDHWMFSPDLPGPFFGPQAYESLTAPTPEPFQPDYNAARKTDAIVAKRRELGWDFVPDGLWRTTATLKPVRPDAAPRRVMKESIALIRMRPAERFTRRQR